VGESMVDIQYAAVKNSPREKKTGTAAAEYNGLSIRPTMGGHNYITFSKHNPSLYLCTSTVYLRSSHFLLTYWATVCKMVRPMSSDRCVFVLYCPVCDVGVLWLGMELGLGRNHIALDGDPAPTPRRKTAQ